MKDELEERVEGYDDVMVRLFEEREDVAHVVIATIFAQFLANRCINEHEALLKKKQILKTVDGAIRTAKIVGALPWVQGRAH